MKFRIFSLILLSFVSCKSMQDFPDTEFIQCDSNCYDLHIQGRIYNPVVDTGINDILVTTKWENYYCFFCSDDKIDTTYSSKDGYFHLDVSLDTTYFSNGYHLDMNIPKQKDYLDYTTLEHSFFEIPDSNIININFTLIPSATLEIHLNRVEKDTFQDFSLSWDFLEHFTVWNAIEVENNAIVSGDTIISLTAADVKTFITWAKKINDKEKITKTDSIICGRNQKNIFTINY